MSVPTYPASGTYVKDPSAPMVTEPCDGLVVEAGTTVSRVPVSLSSVPLGAGTVTVVLTRVVAASSFAAGAAGGGDCESTSSDVAVFFEGKNVQRSSPLASPSVPPVSGQCWLALSPLASPNARRPPVLSMPIPGAAKSCSGRPGENVLHSVPESTSPTRAPVLVRYVRSSKKTVVQLPVNGHTPCGGLSRVIVGPPSVELSTSSIGAWYSPARITARTLYASSLAGSGRRLLSFPSQVTVVFPGGTTPRRARLPGRPGSKSTPSREITIS